MHIREILQDVPLFAISQVRAVLAAWVQFTHIPLPPAAKKLHIGKADPVQAVRYMPLISGLVGLVAALALISVDWATQSRGTAVIIATGVMLAMTGAFRERGAAHFFDTFSRRETNTKARAIGATGTVALIMLIIAKWQFIAAMPVMVAAAALIAASSFSTFATLAFLYTHKPLLPQMHGRFTDFSRVRLHDTDFIVMALFGMLPVTLLGHPAFFLLLPILWIVRALVALYLVRKPERYSSDALAATQQFTELGMYLGIMVISRILAAL